MAVSLWLAGCASVPPEPIAAPPVATMQPPPAARAKPDTDIDVALANFEARQVALALAAEGRGHWAAAALAWEVLSLVQPDDPAHPSRWAAARRRIESLSAERQAAADSAQRRGDLETARQAWLELLALDPGHRTAADSLRQIERERTRRTSIGRFARNPLARRGSDAGHATADGGEQSRSSNSLREHASMLTQQGDLDGAIQLLRDATLQRTDALLRSLLADLYVRKAETVRQRQPDVARAAVEAALALDRRHAGALALQQQLNPARSRSTAPPTPGR